MCSLWSVNHKENQNKVKGGEKVTFKIIVRALSLPKIQFKVIHLHLRTADKPSVKCLTI